MVGTNGTRNINWPWWLGGLRKVGWRIQFVKDVGKGCGGGISELILGHLMYAISGQRVRY